MVYRINDDCISCGACEAECPVNWISSEDGKYQIDADGKRITRQTTKKHFKHSRGDGEPSPLLFKSGSIQSKISIVNENAEEFYIF